MTNFQGLFYIMLKYKQHHAILLLKRFHLNTYNNYLWVSFRVKGQHLIRSKQYHVKVLLQRFHLNGSTIGFYPKTLKLDTALIKFLKVGAHVFMGTPREKPPTPLAKLAKKTVSLSHFFKQKGYHDESFILQLSQFCWVFCLDSVPTLPLH